jgi:hypothetical protein
LTLLSLLGYKPTVTTPQGDAPDGGPTPEEISARLEALLKRTHAMRAQQKASGPTHGMTWPPPDRELDHYDVVDVPERRAMQAAPSPAAATHAAPGPDGSPPADAPHAPSQGGAAPPGVQASASTTSDTPGFARPDWSELRLRSMADEPATTPRWLVVLTIILAITTLGQAGYLWSLRQGNVVAGTGQLRVDGPEGAQVRVDGRAIGPAPIEHALPPGDYQVEIVSGQSEARSQRVSVGIGRTVVLLPLEATTARQTTGPETTVPGPGSSRGASPARQSPAPPAAATGVAGVSATLGAVAIESTPPGLPVTMEGRERGVTPLTIGQLKPGRHDVLVGGLARKVDIAANQVATLRVTRP